MIEEPLTPAEVEAKLRYAVTALDRAQKELAEARERHTDARIAFDLAQARALLAPDAPRVARGAATAAERDAWVLQSVEKEFVALGVAEVRERVAVDRLRTVQSIADVLRSLNRAAVNAFNLAGS